MMALVQLARQQLVGLLLGPGLAAAIFIGGIVLATSVMEAGASPGDGAVHLRIHKFTGQARAVPPGLSPNCNANETQVDVASFLNLASLEARLDLLELQVPDCLSQDVDGTARFTGCNVQIVNGTGSTLNTNGAGNLIVGYNENPFGATRTGSRNIVVGFANDYLSFGGLVVGLQNTISAAYATVTGGTQNAATGVFSSVSGGSNNTANGPTASISGGVENMASGPNSSVGGGQSNTASGASSAVGGGVGLNAGNSQFLP